MEEVVLRHRDSIQSFKLKQLEKDDSRAVDKRAEILVTLRRRVKGKKLQGEKGPDGWIFWVEQ